MEILASLMKTHTVELIVLTKGINVAASNIKHIDMMWA